VPTATPVISAISSYDISSTSRSSNVNRQVGRELGPALETPQGRQGAHQRFLNKVFGILPFSRQSQCKSEQPRGVIPRHPIEGVGRSPADTVEQFGRLALGGLSLNRLDTGRGPGFRSFFHDE